MATEEKIENDEVMSDDELDQVAGGSNSEIRGLLANLPKHAYMRAGHQCTRLMTLDEAKDWLKAFLDIDVTFHYGEDEHWHELKIPNVYTREGKSVTHQEVVKEIKRIANYQRNHSGWVYIYG